MMLEEIIANLIYNRKRYLYSFLAFVFAVLLVTVGLFKALFVVMVTIVGYYLGSPDLNKKFKKIKKILSDEADSIKNKWGNKWVEE